MVTATVDAVVVSSVKNCATVNAAQTPVTTSPANSRRTARGIA
jgi:hypothetical protein